MDRRRIRGAIFDVDGTLINSNDAHARAWVDALQENSLGASYSDVRRLIGMGGDKLVPALTGLPADSQRAKAIQAARGRIFREQYLPHLRSFPRVRQLWLRLRDSGVRLAVASSAQASELNELLELAGVRDLVEHVTSSNDAERSKPDPDIVEAALHRLDLQPSQVLMIGDTPYDIQAAARLGVATLAVRSGGWSSRELVGALAIYEDVAQLLDHLDETPFGRGRPSAYFE